MAVSRVTEITTSSRKGIEDAIRSGVKRAARTLKDITAVEVVSIKARVDKGRVREYRVSLKISFMIGEPL
jgi:hypothetical protein